MSSCANARTNYSSIRSNVSVSNLSRSTAMPLVKGGGIIEDPFIRIPDDIPIPDDAVIVSASRLLSNAADLIQRAAPIGVLWPNDRKFTELVPFLDRLALVALVFP